MALDNMPQDAPGGSVMGMNPRGKPPHIYHTSTPTHAKSRGLMGIDDE